MTPRLKFKIIHHRERILFKFWLRYNPSGLPHFRRFAPCRSYERSYIRDFWINANANVEKEEIVYCVRDQMKHNSRGSRPYVAVL